MSTLSSKVGWHLFKITIAYRGFSNLVITNFESMIKYKLTAGNQVKIQKGSDYDQFIIWPYIQEYETNSLLMEQLVNHFENLPNHKDENYIKKINNLRDTMNALSNDPKGFIPDAVMISDEPNQIGMPISWLQEKNVNLGDSVLLRNDEPSPIIF